MKPGLRLSGSLITRLFTAFLLFAFAALVNAMSIPWYRMDSLAIHSDIVVFCQEESVKKVSLKHDNYAEEYTSVKCKVLRAFKGSFKPGSEITVYYSTLFDRNPFADYRPPGKNHDLPLGKALVFLRKNESGRYDVLDAKLVRKDAIYRYVQIGNPGGLKLVKQGPENITLSKTQEYDEPALLQDMALAWKKAQSLKEAASMHYGPGDYANGFAYDDPVDDAIARLPAARLKASCDIGFQLPRSGN